MKAFSRFRLTGLVLVACTLPSLAQTLSFPVQKTAGPSLTFGNPENTSALQTAYVAAVDNLLTINTIPYTSDGKASEYNQTGLLSSDPAAFIRAGGGYAQPWTRDASVNSWNAASLLEPAVARNTLLAVLRRQVDGKLIVQQDNQWWDQVIWISSAWNHYLITGDTKFLADAYQAAQQTLAHDKQLHFNVQRGLFEGAAFLNDGIAGYPVPPADPKESRGSFVLDYPGADRIMVLSTNCLYANAYESAAHMAEALHRPAAEASSLRKSAATLASRIRQQLWLPDRGRFAYFMYPDGKLDSSQEGAGLAFSILFKVATPDQTRSMLDSVHVDPHGLVDVYPAFPRFSAEHPGRHNQIVWPPIQAFWAEAAARQGDLSAFSSEVSRLADLVVSNDGHFWEIYNAASGKPDGGWQTNHQWDSEQDQTWSATGYLRMVYAGLFGMRFSPDGLAFEPSLPAVWGDVTLSNLVYRDTRLTVELHGEGNLVQKVTLDGMPQKRAFLPSSLHGTHRLRIDLVPRTSARP